MLEQYEMHSKIGPLYLVASSNGLQGIFWLPKIAELNKTPTNKFILQAKDELEEYLLGERRSFNVALDIIGSDFQKKLWLYVNPGTGYWGPANRFGVTSEITLAKLTSV